MTAKDDALKAVDNQWRGAWEIHERAACWSATGIRHALVALASEHRVEVRSIKVHKVRNVRFEYRLPQKAKP